MTNVTIVERKQPILPSDELVSKVRAYAKANATHSGWNLMANVKDEALKAAIEAGHCLTATGAIKAAHKRLIAPQLADLPAPTNDAAKGIFRAKVDANGRIVK